MYNSGDAAEQIVRISLEGTEVALKLTGSAAKNIAAMIYTVLKNRDKNKTKGRQRLTAMLKSGKELKVFTVSEEHLKQFAAEAKRYGVVYCALRGKEKSADGMVDIIPKFAGCVWGVEWFRDRGLWQDNSYEPCPGDIIFFDWDNKGSSGPQDGESDHVGIVEKVENGTVYTVEGNSGDSCRENHYAVGYYEIMGYGVPQY